MFYDIIVVFMLIIICKKPLYGLRFIKKQVRIIIIIIIIKGTHEEKKLSCY